MTDTTKAIEAAIEAGARASFDFSNGGGEFDKLDADGNARAWIMQTTRTAVLAAMSTLRPAIIADARKAAFEECATMLRRRANGLEDGLSPSEASALRTAADAIDNTIMREELKREAG